jgi:hypothetical protein
MTHTLTHTDKPAAEFIEINGVRLTYSQTGSGSLAIYAHGIIFSRASDRGLGLFDFSPIATDHRSRKNKRAPNPMSTLPDSQRRREAKRGCVANFSPNLPER